MNSLQRNSRLPSLLVIVWALLFAARAAAEATAKPDPDEALKMSSNAEAVWFQIERLLTYRRSASELGYPELPRPLIAPYARFESDADHLAFDLGLWFSETFPDDPRCWQWLEWALSVQHSVVGVGSRAQPAAPDEQVTARDRAIRFEKLKRRALSAEAVPEQLKASILTAGLYATVQAGMIGRGEPFDWLSATERLAEIGTRYPTANEETLRFLTSILLGGVRKRQPAEAGRLGDLLRQSPNPTIRAAATRDVEIERARRVPVGIRFTAMDGREVDTDKMIGRVVLIDFRGVTWCGACRVEEPHLKEIYAKYQACGFEVITITMEPSPRSRDFVGKYIRERGLVWPHYWDGRRDNPIALRFGINAAPEYLLLGKNGLLVEQMRGSGGLKNLEALVCRELGIPPVKAD